MEYAHSLPLSRPYLPGAHVAQQLQPTCLRLLGTDIYQAFHFPNSGLLVSVQAGRLYNSKFYAPSRGGEQQGEISYPAWDSAVKAATTTEELSALLPPHRATHFEVSMAWPQQGGEHDGAGSRTLKLLNADQAMALGLLVHITQPTPCTLQALHAWPKGHTATFVPLHTVEWLLDAACAADALHAFADGLE